MTKKLSETIAEVNYDHLVYSNDKEIITSGVIIASGQGELKRGTALAKNSDNKMVILGTKVAEQEDQFYEADCILCDDVDATSSDVDTVAYISGHFNKDALILAQDYTITEKDKDTFRAKGIVLSTIQG